MDILGNIEARLAASIAEADEANKRASMLRALGFTWRFFVDPPEYVAETAQATVTELAEVRARREAGPDEHGTGALATVSRLPGIDGELMTAQQHMEQDARRKIEIAHAMGPDKVSLEEVTEKPPVD